MNLMCQPSQVTLMQLTYLHLAALFGTILSDYIYVKP